MNFQLTFEQVAVIGIVASALVVFLRLVYEVAAKRKFEVPDLVMIAIVYIASLALAVWFFPQTIPALPVFAGEITADIAAALVYVGHMLLVLTAYVTAASVVYLVLLEKVKNGLGHGVAPKLYLVA